MSTTIRLMRLGGHRKPYYRIVVTDSRNPRDGRFIESIGFYDPMAKQGQYKLNTERLQSWLSKGVKPSVTVQQIIKRVSAGAA